MIAAAMALALGALPGCSSGGEHAPPSGSRAPAAASASGFAGAALPPGYVQIPDLTLRDQGEARVSLSELGGRVTIIAFLSSACGAACRVIAQQIRGALDDLSAPVPVLLISADRAADGPAAVRRFLARAALLGRARYLTGSPAQLHAAWRTFHVVPSSAGRTAFGRSAPVYVLDRAGRPRVLFQLEQLTPEGLAHDVRVLQRERR